MDLKKVFTSESVSEGHPDKLCDQISDAILDECLRQDENSRVACECYVTTNHLIIGGEITTKAKIDYKSVARRVIRDVGYTNKKYGLDADSCRIDVYVKTQSLDIARGVDNNGAGDQGIMFGYATNETKGYMPLPIVMAHKLVRVATKLRKEGKFKWARPDMKSQVSVDYTNPEKPRLLTVVMSVQHDPNYKKMKAQYAERYLKIRQQNILKEEATAAQEVAVLLAETNKKTQIIKAQAEAESELLRAKAHGESLKAQGASYNMETARIVGTKAAENESQNGSSIVSDLISAGVGLGIGSHVVNNVMDNVSSGLTWTCKKCGHSGNKGNFCENCGQKKENN